MLPKIVARTIADYMDVFCDQGFFSNEETDQLLEAAKYGLKAKIHEMNWDLLVVFKQQLKQGIKCRSP